MAWTAPTTRATGDLITASIYNGDLVDNLLALKDPPYAEYVLDEGADYTTTSSTFVDIDNTNLSLDLTITGDTVLVGFIGSFRGNNLVFIDVSVDSSRVAGDDGIFGQGTFNTLPGLPANFVLPVTGLTPGLRNFKLQWKTNGTAYLYAGAGTSNGDIHPRFFVVEMG